MDEKQMTAALTADLNACRDDNEQLEAEKAALTNVSQQLPTAQMTKNL